MSNLPEGFHDTVLGALPSTWKVAPLGNVAAINLGRTPRRKEVDKYWTDGVIPWVTISDLNNSIVYETGERVSRKAFEEVFNEVLVPKGSLLLSFKLTIGKVGILGIDAVHNEAIASFSLGDDLERDYLFYLFQNINYDDYLDTYLKGKTLNKGKLQIFPIPIPPLLEQRAIAHVLRTVRQAREVTEHVIEAGRELKRSLMHHLFTYGPIPVAQADQVELQETETGSIPAHWQIMKLGDLAEIVAGGTPSRSESEYWNGDIPWVKTGEIDYNVITSTEESITKKGLDNSSAKLFKKGTLLVAMYGQGVTRGRVAILGIEAATNQACAAIFTSKDIIDDSFLFQFFAFRYESIRNLGHGAHQKNLSATLLRTVPVLVPTLKEQHEIARVLTTVDAKIATEEARRDALDDLFHTLLHHLMTAKVRVPLHNKE